MTRAGSSCRRRSAAISPSEGFVSQFDNCLGVWTEEGFADVAKRLTEKIREGLAPQDAMRAFSANAAEVKPDSPGPHPPARSASATSPASIATSS